VVLVTEGLGEVVWVFVGTAEACVVVCTVLCGVEDELADGLALV